MLVTLWPEELKKWAEHWPQLDGTHIASGMFGHCAMSHGLSRHSTSSMSLHLTPVLQKILDNLYIFLLIIWSLFSMKFNKVKTITKLL